MFIADPQAQWTLRIKNWSGKRDYHSRSIFLKKFRLFETASFRCTQLCTHLLRLPGPSSPPSRQAAETPHLLRVSAVSEMPVRHRQQRLLKNTQEAKSTGLRRPNALSRRSPRARPAPMRKPFTNCPNDEVQEKYRNTDHGLPSLQAHAPYRYTRYAAADPRRGVGAALTARCRTTTARQCAVCSMRCWCLSRNWPTTRSRPRPQLATSAQEASQDNGPLPQSGYSQEPLRSERKGVCLAGEHLRRLFMIDHSRPPMRSAHRHQPVAPVRYPHAD